MREGKENESQRFSSLDHVRLRDPQRSGLRGDSNARDDAARVFGDVQRGGVQGAGSAEIRVDSARGVWGSLFEVCEVLSGESVVESGFGEWGDDAVGVAGEGDEQGST